MSRRQRKEREKKLLFNAKVRALLLSIPKNMIIASVRVQL